MKQPNVSSMLLGLLCFVLDRLTKYWALAYMQQQTVYPVTSWLSYEFVYNRGVSWGMLHGQDEQQFIMVSLGIACITALVALHAYYQYKEGCSITGHMLVIGGSLSNIIDRIYYGGVIDFIHIHYLDWSWPVFNIADVGIVIGALLMIVMSVRD